jgi:hypothetical protein
VCLALADENAGKGAKRDRRNQMDLADLRQQAKYYMKLGVKQNRIQTARSSHAAQEQLRRDRCRKPGRAPARG